jgi:aquaporin Z
MSLNPARSFASALPAGDWSGWWVYLTAPLLGMLLAAETWLRLSSRGVRSAKLAHDAHQRCIFHCDQHEGRPRHGRPRRGGLTT